MLNLHIMVIEDDPDTLEYVYNLLAMHSYKVSRWRTSIVAVEQVAHRQPDLVVLDQHLVGDATGIQITHRLHALPETAHIPVVLYSSDRHLVQTYRDELRSMGGDVLEKPFEPEELLRKIEALLASVEA